jgi:hypothetical protein
MVEVINYTCTELIKFGKHEKLLAQLHLLEHSLPLRCSFELEHFLGREIQRVLQNRDKDLDPLCILHLLKDYSRTVYSILKNNLNLTFDELSQTTEGSLEEMIVSRDPKYLSMLRLPQVMASICQWIDESFSVEQSQTRADMQVFTDSMIQALTTFFRVHPYFSTDPGTQLTEQAGEEAWTQILNSIDFEKKNEMMKTYERTMTRVELMDHLLPGNVVIYHFLYSLTPQMWTPDRTFSLTWENNLKPLVTLTEGLAEEYLLTLDNWLVLCTDTSLSFNDMLQNFQEIRLMSQAIVQLLPSQNAFLPSSLQCDTIKWHINNVQLLLSGEEMNKYGNRMNSCFLELMTSFDIQSLEVSPEEGVLAMKSLAKVCASPKKNSAFMRFPKEEMSMLKEHFMENNVLSNGHSFVSGLLSTLSFVTGDSDFFFRCFEDPVLMGRNPLVVKKQNYYFLLTILKSNPDAVKAKQIREHFEPEISMCLSTDKLVLDLTLASIENPEECSALFHRELMNPLYLEIIKQKMGLFYRVYLEALQRPPVDEEGNPLEESLLRDNLYDGTLNQEDLQTNRNIHTRGSYKQNGNDIISDFDPKNVGIEDKFRGLGDLDLRPGAVIGFQSKLGGKVKEEVN